MNVLSLCSGIGGLDLGIRLAYPEARTICFVEREAYAAAILVSRMQDGTLDQAPIWSDLATFDGREWRGVVDCVCAGYPCQPFSTAGRRGGTDDPRHLWPHVARIVRECEPGLVLIENVPGHLSLGFDEVCRELDGMGYRIAAGVFSAAEVGAPHRRERLFALAHRDMPRGGDAEPVGERRAAAELGCVSEDVAHRDPLAHRDGHGCELRGLTAQRDQGQSQPEPAERGGSVADAVRERGCGGQSGGEDAAATEAAVGGVGCWPPGPNADWSGIPGRLWPATAQPSIRGMAHGDAARVDRLRALGNGVVPAVAARALATLAAELAR